MHGHTNAVYHLAFSADGSRLASAGYDDRLKLWDVTGGREPLTLKGHDDWIMSLAFSADGKWFASASLDQTVKVWDTTTGQELLMWKGHNDFVMRVAKEIQDYPTRMALR